ncbi:hypothetical protein L6452_27996 [Arctium lappa]|uniref:Uncharacterized protein n=1 Tax=Arctium lappa TaxID=4217 RepID=A0ACB8ZXH6_ARCLA|nr:hypothetical protein L6452_27996 [Arctium lappa]
MPHMLRGSGPRRLPWPPGNTVGYGHGGATKKGGNRMGMRETVLLVAMVVVGIATIVATIAHIDSTVETAKVEANIVSYKIAQVVIVL